MEGIGPGLRSAVLAKLSPEETVRMHTADETPVSPLQGTHAVRVYWSTSEASICPEGAAGTEPTTRPQWATEKRKLVRRYRAILKQKYVGRGKAYRFRRLLGKGGQGRVFLVRWSGADGFSRPIALKVNSPELYATVEDYENAMRHSATVAAKVADTYDAHLVDVLQIQEFDGIRVVLMEWIDGYDLRRLLQTAMMERFRELASDSDRTHIATVVVTDGAEQPRLHPGAAVTIIRDCLSGLMTLHARSILHGDLRPANIMLQRAGTAKIVDFGSAVMMNDQHRLRVFTPAYAAPEVLESKAWSAQSDLASLGYVLIELLTGRRLFPPSLTIDELVARKRALPSQLRQMLPDQSRTLIRFCRRLIAVDPRDRFMSAEQADMDRDHGAFRFQQELIEGRLGSAWDHDLGIWMSILLGEKSVV
jgi:serine/threonine-protein kinase